MPRRSTYPAWSIGALKAHQEAPSFMQFRPNYKHLLMLVSLIVFSISCPNQIPADERPSAKSNRLSPLVHAVQNCRNSVVNLRGRKTVLVDPQNASSQDTKQVNGMGTGVVINSRGYVLTNYHVVEGVKTIEVTTSEREKTTATLLAHDPETDLAILKIETKEPLPPITIGSSSDLMLAEQVIAVGNAYGYEHTVTLGIISSLRRTVQVNDDQIYRNLIQTDAAINPGNSGGPLLNINGEMIGINVAVRIGAQGIAFAIPVNDAIEIAAELMSQIVPNDLFHGISTQTVYTENQPSLIVNAIIPQSPAEKAGLRSGDTITKVNGKAVALELDFQTAVLFAAEDKSVMVTAVQDGKPKTFVVSLAKSNQSSAPNSIAWIPLGLKLEPIPASQMEDRHPNYKRGLKVKSVRSDSPAEKEGIMPGDILVAMHGWKTETLENLAYILQRPDVIERKDFMFYILRDKEPFWGQMRVANLPTH
jgi:serine protease Do